MEIKINEIQPLMLDPRLMPELTDKKSRVIKPIPKGKGSLSKRVGDDKESRRETREASEAWNGDEGQLSDDANSLMEDAVSSPSPCDMSETGGFTGDVPNPCTGEAIRRVSPGNMIKIHGKPGERRGVIFDAKI